MDARVKARVDYEDLVRAYRASLATVLRGFKAGPDFLDLWVPDDDHHKSILNLVESAESAGLNGVSIYVGADTLAGLNLAQLEKMIGSIARVRVAPDGDGILLEINYG